MTTTAPEKLKKTLGIYSWRQLSKEHVIQFASALPQLDKEVAINIVRQFPNFKDLATSALAQLQKRSKKLLRTATKVKNVCMSPSRIGAKSWRNS